MNIDAESLILVTGSGRSGTTWLAELLNYDHSHRFIHEPFCPTEVDLWGHCSHTQYLRPDETSRHHAEPAQRILAGEVDNPWVSQYNHSPNNQRRIIKDIRTNLLLGWFRQRFPYFPIILIVRHPCAVALSSTRLHWQINPEEVFLPQAELRADYLEPFIATIRSAQTQFERYIVNWCIEQYVPFQQLTADDKVLVVSYENLVMRPRAELERIYNYLGQPFPAQVMRVIKKQSATGRTVPYYRYITRRKSLIYDWTRQLTPEQLAYANKTVAAFGLNAFYSDDPLPRSVGSVAGTLRPHRPF